MSDVAVRRDGSVSEARSGEGGLSQVERVVDAFVAPTKTFEDIRRNASWWMPWLVSAVVGLLFAYVVLNKIGMSTLVDGVIQQSASLQEQIANSTPAQAETLRGGMEMRFKFMYVGPVIFLIVGLIASAVLLGTANFVFGGRATYNQMLAVWFYGTLPLIFISVLTIVSLYVGMSGDSFNIRNTLGTNVGYYLMNSAPLWLVTMLSSVDIVAIWAAVLLTMGVSTVAGIKRGAAAAMVFGWWGIYVLLQTGIAAFTG
jgi:hypothetical protein